MKKWTKELAAISVGAAALFTSAAALAHTPLCSCYDSGGGKIMCEGGFSDGSSARGVKMRVVVDIGSAFFMVCLYYRLYF